MQSKKNPTRIVWRLSDERFGVLDYDAAHVAFDTVSMVQLAV
jgi:hypothetical protein